MLRPAVSPSRAALALAALALWFGPAHANECARLGSPSYEAKRTVTIGPQTIEARVLVSGVMEREEARTGDRTTIRIIDGKRSVQFDDKSRQGFAVPLQAQPGGPKLGKEAGPPGHARVDWEKVGEHHVSRLLVKKDENWVEVITVTCRADGVMLERVFPANVQGRPVRAVLRQSDIKLKPVPPSAFEVPKDVKLKSR